MSLTIGVRVKKQSEVYGDAGHNPKGSEEEISERFASHLERAFPRGGFGGADVLVLREEYDFHVEMFGYAGEFAAKGYVQDDMYLAILAFVLGEFSVIHGIEMTLYWAG